MSMGLVATALAACGWTAGLRLVLGALDAWDECHSSLELYVDEGYIAEREAPLPPVYMGG